MPFKKLFGFTKKAKAAGVPRTVVVDVAVKVEQTAKAVFGAEEIFQHSLEAQGPVHVSIVFDKNGEVTACKMEHLEVATAAPAALSNATTLVGSPMPSKPTSPLAAANDLSQDEPADSSSCPTVVSRVDIPLTAPATLKIAAHAPAKRALKTEDFRMIRVLGEGGQGLVMLVQDRLTDKLYALKAIKKHRLQTQDLPTVFVEQNVMMTLAGRPLFTSLKGSFEDEDHFFLLTDYCSGGDLDERIRKEGKLPTDVARRYAAQIVLAMEELRQMRIVHRDIKPKNILLTAQDEVIVTDFGLARTFGRTREQQPWRMRKIWQRKENLAEDEGTKTGPQRDRSGGGCGTFGYIAPEMFAGDYSYEVDVWSFAVTLYEMLHGKLPFGYDRVDGATTNELITRTFVVPVEIDSDMDADAADLLQAMLAKDPLKRPTWDQIKEHPWFDTIDWKQIANRKPIAAHEAPKDLVPESHAKYISFGDPYGEGEAEYPFFNWVSPELATIASSPSPQNKPSKRFEHGTHGKHHKTTGRPTLISRTSMGSYSSIALAGMAASPTHPTNVHSTATATTSNETPLEAKTATAVFDAIMAGSADSYSDRSFSGFSPRWNTQGIYSSSGPRSPRTGRDPTSLPQTTSLAKPATSNVSYDSLQAVALASLAAALNARPSSHLSATSVSKGFKLSASSRPCSSVASRLFALSSSSSTLGSLSAEYPSSTSCLKAREPSQSRKLKLLTKLQHWWALRGVKEVRRVKGGRMDLLG
ncbi:kinase-like protein [Trametes sanguinea]|nr:kinase-like protein [Trametes sanguinea]